MFHLIRTIRMQLGTVAIGGVMPTVRTGLNQGKQVPSDLFSSLARHLSLSDPDYAGSRHERTPGTEIAAIRAGRSECSAGVLPCAVLARFAGQAIPFGWFASTKPGSANFVGNRPSNAATPSFSAWRTAVLAALPTAASLGSWSAAGNATKAKVLPRQCTRGG
jgi:hypothetical protein